MARKQLQRLSDQGYYFYSATEFEYQLAHRDTLQLVNFDSDAYTNLVFARYEELLFGFERNLYAIGVDLEVLEVEYGHGQFEMAMRPQKGIKASDNAFLYKQTVKVRVTNFSGHIILAFNGS